MLAPFLHLIVKLIDLYSLCITVWVVLELLIYFKIVNTMQPLVMRMRYTLNRLILPVLRPIRKYLPDLGGLDISPVILILLLQFAQEELMHIAYSL
jgi:YggT family protein